MDAAIIDQLLRNLGQECRVEWSFWFSKEGFKGRVNEEDT